ncbi:MAG: hypothetical protein R6V03_02740, partial [Kiritimatiellia bacterium]
MSFSVNSLTRSLWVFHLAGSPCNNCDIEVLDLLTPAYDVERFGMVLVGSVRHADAILLSGAFNKKATIRAKRVYEQAVSEFVKNILNIKKAGHSGSLDPNVTGLLAVATGRATRIVQTLLKSGKEYIGIMHLHEDIDKKDIKKAFKEFTGK